MLFTTLLPNVFNFDGFWIAPVTAKTGIANIMANKNV
jgi:hypothetical protein